MYHKLKKSLDKFVEEGKIKNFKTPFIFFDKSLLKENYLRIKNIFLNGKSHIHYAVKANSELEVISELNNLGSGFEIASVGELLKLEKLKVNPDKIIFSSPVKLEDHISYAYKFGIRTFSYDSTIELDKLAHLAPNSKVILRIDVSNHGARWKLDNKFGAEKKDWILLLEYAQKLKLKPIGITFHVGWNNIKNSTWGRAMKMTGQLVKSAYKKNIKIKYVNIAGGFPAHLVDQEHYLNQIANLLNPILLKLNKNYGIETIIEPGTYVVANCAALITRIYSNIKREKRDWLFVDASITGGFYWILEGLIYDIYLAGPKNKLPYNNLYTITGPTCDSQDTFTKKIKLPKELSNGDILAISPAGAYITSSEEYNGFPYPKTKYF